MAYNLQSSVQFSLRNGQTMTGKVAQLSPSTKEVQIRGTDGELYWRKETAVRPLGTNGEVTTEEGSEVMAQEPDIMDTFTTAEKFEFMGDAADMVIGGITPAAMICGDGGLGKSYEVMARVRAAGLVEGDDYVKIKGNITAKGIYDTLYAENGKLIIFDDCDAALTECPNLMKAALDSDRVREVSWISSFSQSDTPSKFKFEGRVIFVSNLPKSKIPQAIVRRSMTVGLALTADQKIERMEQVLEHMEVETSLEMRMEALELLRKYRHQATDLNLGTLEKVIRIRRQNKPNWERMAMFTILS